MGTKRCAGCQICLTQGAGKEQGDTTLATNLIVFIYEVAATGAESGPAGFTEAIFQVNRGGTRWTLPGKWFGFPFLLLFDFMR